MRELENKNKKLEAPLSSIAARLLTVQRVIRWRAPSCEASYEAICADSYTVRTRDVCMVELLTARSRLYRRRSKREMVYVLILFETLNERTLILIYHD